MKNSSARPIRFVPALVLVAMMAGCAAPGGDVVRRDDANRQAVIQSGVVVSVRNVTIDGTQSGIGAIAGGVVGAVAGSSVGGNRESIAIGTLGAVAGGLAGNAVERRIGQEAGVEIIVRLPDGQQRSIVQPAGTESFLPGDPVNLITQSGRTRVTRAPR